MDTSSWKWFRYTDIFRISGSKTTPVADLETYGKGVFPYVTTQAVNNGVEGFYNYSTEKGCVLTVDSAVLGFCSYQENDFSASDHVEVLTPLFNMNRYIALFLVTLINKEQYRYNYGRKCSQIKLRKSRIKLPVTAEGTPDWKYMETFIKDRIIPQLPKKAQRVWLQKYNTQPQQSAKMQLDTKDWEWFRYDQIFDIKHGFYNKKPEDNPSGDIPFIGATDSNNGVTSHSDLETIAITTKTGDGSNAPLEDKIFANCLAVTNNGSVGYAYYQAKPFTCTHDVNPLYLKGCKINPYIALFLCTLIEKERFRWAYGRKWRPIRMPSSKIKLPVTPSGTPDWQFMEDYIKSLPYSRNIEPSDPNEQVDELIEVKRKVLALEHQLQAQQHSDIHYHINAQNISLQTEGTINIGEINDK